VPFCWQNCKTVRHLCQEETDSFCQSKFVKCLHCSSFFPIDFASIPIMLQHFQCYSYWNTFIWKVFWKANWVSVFEWYMSQFWQWVVYISHFVLTVDKCHSSASPATNTTCRSAWMVAIRRIWSLHIKCKLRVCRVVDSRQNVDDNLYLWIFHGLRLKESLLLCSWSYCHDGRKDGPYTFQAYCWSICQYLWPLPHGY